MKLRSYIWPTIMPGSSARDFSRAKPKEMPISKPTMITTSRDMAALHGREANQRADIATARILDAINDADFLDAEVKVLGRHTDIGIVGEPQPARVETCRGIVCARRNDLKTEQAGEPPKMASIAARPTAMSAGESAAKSRPLFGIELSFRHHGSAAPRPDAT